MNRFYLGLGFLLLLCGAGQLARAQDASIVYTANFKLNEPDWPNYNDSYAEEKHENGRYYVTHKKNKFSYKAIEIALEDERPYRIETVMTHVAGSAENQAGLAFAGDGESDNYFFTIAADGTFSFACRNGGYFKAIINPKHSKAIKQGNASNKLAIETDGQEVKLFINDQQVDKINAGEPFGNEIGFIAEREQTVAFDYLTVKYLGDSPDFVPPSATTVAQTTKNTPPATTAPSPVAVPAAVANTAVSQVRPSPDTVKKSAAAIVAANVATQPTGGGAQQSIAEINKPAGHSAADKDTAKNQPPVMAAIRPPAVSVRDTSAKTNQVQALAAVKDTTARVIASGPGVVATTIPIAVAKPIALPDSVHKPQVAQNQATPAAAPVNPQVNPAIKQLAYFTDFSKDDENNWTARTLDSTLVNFNNGFNVMHIAGNGAAKILSRLRDEPDMHRNFLIETEVTHENGVKNYGYGIAFGGDSLRQYYFCITDSGLYYINQYFNKSFHVIVPNTPTDAVHIGDHVKNKLTIKHLDGQLYFYVNDQKVDSHVDFPFYGERFGPVVSSAQSVNFHNFTFGYLDKPSTNPDSVQWPKVTVISPEVTRGLHIVQNSDMLHVVGKATDPSGIYSVHVNEVVATTDSLGNFTADILMDIGDNPLRVTALNNNMKKATFNFHIVRNVISVDDQAAVSKMASQGKYYALLIAEQNYDDPNITSLEGPVSDSRKLAETLVKNYTFEASDVKILKNPTRAEFLGRLDELASTIKSEDNLIIFYAGHGIFEESRQQGYWFPSDAKRNRRDTWISNTDLIEYIAAIKSKHTLLISDACFSGSIFKSRGGMGIEMAPKDIQAVYKLISRKAMTSGAMTEVPDKSVFIDYLVKRLIENNENYLPSETLFTNFKAAVIANSESEQVPQFGEIKGAGDEGGDFIFIKRTP